MFFLNQGCVHSLYLISGLQCSSELIMKPVVKAELLGLSTRDTFSKRPYSLKFSLVRQTLCLSIYTFQAFQPKVFLMSYCR